MSIENAHVLQGEVPILELVPRDRIAHKKGEATRLPLTSELAANAATLVETLVKQDSGSDRLARIVDTLSDII